MLAQRLRRWPNIKTSLFQRVVFAGIAHNYHLFGIDSSQYLDHTKEFLDHTNRKYNFHASNVLVSIVLYKSQVVYVFYLYQEFIQKACGYRPILYNSSSTSTVGQSNCSNWLLEK